MSTLDAIRTAGEHDIEEVLRQLDDRHKAMLREAIKHYGRVQDVPEIVWKEIQFNMEEQTAAAIVMLMVAADDWATDVIRGGGVKQARLTQEHQRRYANVADLRARATAISTTRTLRGRVEQKLKTAALSPDGGIGTITDRSLGRALEDVFTQSRRDTLAIDLSTRAIADGQRGAAQRATDGGATTTAGVPATIELIWRTERDNLVCDYCSPLEGTTEDVWGRVYPDGPGPDAHPNCRCSLDPRVVPRLADER